MKIKKLFILVFMVVLGSSCERKMKEHPLPDSLRQKIIKKNDPALKAKEISGAITVDEKYANSIPKNARLFIIVRPEGVEGGPPLAVKRHSMVEFPFAYTIGPSNVMLEGNRFEGPLALKVRIDRDGDAGVSPGDIEGARMARPGEKRVDVVLNKIIPEVKDSVSGTLRIDPELAKILPDAWKLFLFARPVGVAGGPPTAVKLLDSVKFPHSFTIGEENIMTPGSTFEGRMTLTARIDQDGDARSGAGDLEGIATVNAGDERVELIIDRRVGG